jgi:hypothetical protein
VAPCAYLRAGRSRAAPPCLHEAHRCEARGCGHPGRRQERRSAPCQLSLPGPQPGTRALRLAGLADVGSATERRLRAEGGDQPPRHRRASSPRLQPWRVCAVVCDSLHMGLGSMRLVPWGAGSAMTPPASTTPVPSRSTARTTSAASIRRSCPTRCPNLAPGPLGWPVLLGLGHRPGGHPGYQRPNTGGRCCTCICAFVHGSGSCSRSCCPPQCRYCCNQTCTSGIIVAAISARGSNGAFSGAAVPMRPTA